MKGSEYFLILLWTSNYDGTALDLYVLRVRTTLFSRIHSMSIRIIKISMNIKMHYHFIPHSPIDFFFFSKIDYIGT